MTRAFLSALVSLPLLTAAASAQVQSEWVEVLDPTARGFDWAEAVGLASDGGVFVAGTQGGGPGQVPYSFFVARYGPSGVLAWTREFAIGAGVGYARDLAVDTASDEVYVAGESLISSSSAGVLLKYDAAGALLWSRSWAGPGGGGGFRAVELAPAGGVIAAGFGRSSGGDSDLAGVRYDAAGTLVWERLVHDAAGADGHGDCLAVDAAGGAVIGGRNAAGGSDSNFAVARLSPSGTVAWSEELDLGGPGLQRANVVALAASGTVYAAGSLSTPATLDDAGLVAIDASGAVLWTRTLDGTLPAASFSEMYRGIAIAPNGNVRLCGMLEQTGTSIDALVAEYTPAGSLAWSLLWNGRISSYDYAHWITIEPDGSSTVCGASRGSTAPRYDQATLRVEADGTLRWARILPAADTRPFAFFDIAGVPGGPRIFAGRTDPSGGEPTDVVVLAEHDQALPYCLGDALASACPCGNGGGLGQGCANSTGAGARLFDLGVASLSVDTLSLKTVGLPANTVAVVLQGSASSSPTPFGDGLACIGGNVVRLVSGPSQSGVLQLPAPGDFPLSVLSLAHGDPLAPGSVRYFQTWYHEPDAGFCTAPTGADWNVSAALRVTWAN